MDFQTGIVHRVAGQAETPLQRVRQVLDGAQSPTYGLMPFDIDRMPP